MSNAVLIEDALFLRNNVFPKVYPGLSEAELDKFRGLFNTLFVDKERYRVYPEKIAMKFQKKEWST